MAKVFSEGGAFLTQKGEKYNEVKAEINELEQLLAATGQTSQSTLLLKKRKEMREVDESLELMKKDHKKRMEDCEERRLQFELKQAKMREQVLKFEKFIQENDAKRVRAEAKIKLERKLYEEKVKEISALSDKIQKLEEDSKQLSDQLAKISCYKLYLERIVEEGEFGYEEISEILNRHFTLKQANKDLLDHSLQFEKKVDLCRRQLQNLKTEKQNQVLVSTSILQKLQGELEKFRSQFKNQEEEKVLRENKKKDVSREYSQIIQAIKNLYGRCLSTMRVKQGYSNNNPTGSSNNANNSIIDLLDSELDVILTRMIDLIEITSEYNDESFNNSFVNSGSMYQTGNGNTNLPPPPTGDTTNNKSEVFPNQSMATKSLVSNNSFEKRR